MTATQCPPAERLRDFLGGRLSEEDSVALESHLSSCDLCEETATSLEAEPDTFAEFLVGGNEMPVSARAVEAFEHAVPLVATERSSATIQVTGSVGSYDLLERLGRGGMGSVYLARHRELDRHVAIKLLPSLTARKEEVVARFRREMKAAGRLDHPAIVRATDAGELEGTHFLVMEVVNGTDLSQLTAGVQLSVANACEIVRQAAVGLAYAHEQGIVHRDVKPSNLMLDRTGRVKILDFGLAQLYQDDGSADELTSIGQLMGTLEYMAPEQAARGNTVDARADVYSLGATLFRLLTGKSPLDCEGDFSPIEKLRVLSEHRRRDLEDFRADVPAALNSLMEKMLASEPESRPEDCLEVSRRIAEFCEGAELGQLHGISATQTVVSSSALLSEESQAAANLDATSAGSGWGSRVFGSLVAAAGAFLILGGIWLALELSKGQLVIDTEAEVTLRLIDENERVKELRIEPGAATTRLRDGKYEITIAEPSDGFSISKDVISIHRGDVVIARVMRRLAGDQAGMGPRNSGFDRPNQPPVRNLNPVPFSSQGGYQGNGRSGNHPGDPFSEAHSPSRQAPALPGSSPAGSARAPDNLPAANRNQVDRNPRNDLPRNEAFRPNENFNPREATPEFSGDPFADPSLPPAMRDPFGGTNDNRLGGRNDNPFGGSNSNPFAENDGSAFENRDNSRRDEPFSDDPFGGNGQPGRNPFGDSAPRRNATTARSNNQIPDLPPRKNGNPSLGQSFDAPVSSPGSSEFRDPVLLVPNEDGTLQTNLNFNSIDQAEQDQTARIYQALKQRLELDWHEIPLKQIGMQIADELDIPVWINERALTAAGLSTDLPLNLSMPPISVSSALRLAFERHGLAYIVRNEVLEITTADDIREFQINSGDTLAVLLPNHIAGGKPSPVHQVDGQAPIRGEVYRVDEAGKVVLPHIGEVALGGRSLGEARYLLRSTYFFNVFPSPAGYAGIEVNILTRRGSKQQVVRLYDGTKDRSPARQGDFLDAIPSAELQPVNSDAEDVLEDFEPPMTESRLLENAELKEPRPESGGVPANETSPEISDEPGVVALPEATEPDDTEPEISELGDEAPSLPPPSLGDDS